MKVGGVKLLLSFFILFLTAKRRPLEREEIWVQFKPPVQVWGKASATKRFCWLYQSCMSKHTASIKFVTFCSKKITVGSSLKIQNYRGQTTLLNPNGVKWGRSTDPQPHTYALCACRLPWAPAGFLPGWAN